jgi:hypothetical protein
MPRDDHGSSWASRRAKAFRGAENERRAGHRIVSDGRSRSDASCVLRTGRSQGLVGVRDASPEETPSSPDAGAGVERRRSGARSHQKLNRLESVDRSVGDEPAGSRYDGRRSRTAVRLAFTGGAFRSPLARRKAHRAVRRPTRACLRVTTRASEAGGSFGKGSTRSEKVQGESASSALKSRRFSGAPHAVSPKLVALTAPPIAPPS